MQTQLDHESATSRPTRTSRLELVWINKDTRTRPEPRILIEDQGLSYKASGEAGSDNLLIFGDNLLALKALELDFTSKVKCCFIDPPYNTGSAFAQYEDGLEHSLWLGLMRDRLEIIRRLLRDDGSLWISIDDNEAHYLKVLCDEVFGRRNFVANVVWKKRTSPDARLPLGGAHDHILVFAKSKDALSLNRLKASDTDAAAGNPDGDIRGPWTSTDFTAQGWRPNQMYSIVSPAGVSFAPPPGRCWANVQEVFRKLCDDDRIWFGKTGRSRPRIKTFLSERHGISSWSWWDNKDVGHNQEAKKESIALFGADNAFATPKPERLIKRILDIATDPGDLVLDSFAGSGTTGAVAHKMGRRWIMAELGDHCHTHVIPRLRRVIDGEDPGGVTALTEWRGGGGFRYVRLAPSLIDRDAHGRDVICGNYDGDMLVRALCGLKAYRYAPDETRYWQHGYSTERSFIYVKPEFLPRDELIRLSEDVGPDRALLVLCRAFRGDGAEFPNLTVEKIPGDMLAKCDWGQTSYDLPLSRSPDECTVGNL